MRLCFISGVIDRALFGVTFGQTLKHSMYNIIIPSLFQLLAASPILLVYLAGLILALVFWRRSPTPCLLALIATGLLLLLGVIHPFVSNYLFQAKTEMGWTREKFSSILAFVGLATTCLRAAAMSLLVAGVFVERRVSLQAGPNEFGAENRSQPIGPETNRAPAAASSGR